MTRKVRFIIALAALPILCVGAYAYAGAKYVFPVTVNAANQHAQGSLGSTRNSADAGTYIGCYVTAQPGSSTSATCYAKDPTSHGNCFTTNSAMVAAVESVQGDSWISFDWDASGNCTRVVVDNGSGNEPKN